MTCSRCNSRWPNPSCYVCGESLHEPETATPTDDLGARQKWNAEADENNQWDSLGQDEKEELVAAFFAGKETTNQKTK
jgi:hypothetical protein